MINTEFDIVRRRYLDRINNALDHCLPQSNIEPQRLHEAMRYVCLSGGKRLRPMLAYATGELLGAKAPDLDAAACAVELIHSYSLVHDDLPAMDDDDLRRGLPSCHTAYDEATAILVGDSLLTLAFSVLAGVPPDQAGGECRLRMVGVLAQAAGTAGMTGGQALDLNAVGKNLTPQKLEDIHHRKTGAMIRASVQLGALAGEADDCVLDALDRYARYLGLAFQIVDDVLDETENTGTLGKQSGADRERNKPTFPSVWGLGRSQQMAEDLYQQALDCLDIWGENAYTLRRLAEMLVHRNF